MSIDRCRVCGNKLELLLSYENMPKAAQHMPNMLERLAERGVDLEVHQCKGCGLAQLNNEPVPYYKEVIRAAAFSEEMRSFRIKQFENFVNKYSLQDKKVIEIGCGKGEFLSLMKDAGTNAYGIEYADDSVNLCNDNGLEVSKFYIDSEDDILPAAPYDCFFIMNFFEHLPDPNTTLRALHTNLADDGIGIIEVPNFDMIIKKKLFSEFIGDHLFYFTKETLCNTLAKNGFEVLECSEIWYDYIISVVVRKREKLDITNFYDHQVKIKKEIEDFINHHAGFVAIYGAGHQSFAVISMTKIANKIKYVVDDAPFKQGKYTPATHIPIVSNKHLKNDPVDAIIVMAASYSDEVARKIKQNFNEDISIAILRDFGLEEINE